MTPAPATCEACRQSDQAEEDQHSVFGGRLPNDREYHHALLAKVTRERDEARIEIARLQAFERFFNRHRCEGKRERYSKAGLARDKARRALSNGERGR